MLVLTRGFKRASPSRIKGPGDLRFKARVMLLLVYCPRFAGLLPHFMSFTVLVLTRGFKRASPSRIKGPGDLGFKERVMLRGYRACFDSWL